MTPQQRNLQLRLDGLAQTMQETLMRTSVSPVVREGADCASALFTTGGELLAMSNAIPLLLGALPGIVTAVTAAFPVDTMAEGDLFMTNDPFGGGTHLPDIALLMPVFHEGRVIALATSLLHHQDIGGMRAGSVPPDATEIYQEGLRLPPMHAGTNGRLTAATTALIRAASRVPDVVLGDLDAQAAAGRQAARGLQRIAGEMGTAGFLEAVAGLLDAGEATVVTRLATLPATQATGEDGLDPNPGHGPAEVRLSLTVADGRLHADFAGSSPQVKAPINCVASGPLSAVFYALLTLLGPDAPRNGGILRRLDLTLPQASVVNAAPPAAVNARTNMVRSITSAVLQALGKLAPDGLPAANCGMAYVIAFSGRNGDGTPFLATEIVAGGAGGGPDRPGAPGISTDVGNARNTPAEALEAVLPIRLARAERRLGSGGAGRFPGGDGIRRVYEALADGISVSIRGERFARVPEGAQGGGAPKPAAARVIRADDSVEELPARSAVLLNTGDRLEVESAGGAGYGAAG